MDPAAGYTLATSDFLAGGGDGYEVLKRAEVVLPASGGPLMSNLVTEYLAARGSVSPAVGGRIRVSRAASAPMPRAGEPLAALHLAAALGALLLLLGAGMHCRRGRGR